MNVKIPATEIEFHEGSNTIWIHSPKGGTVLRIKCMGKIEVHKCTSPISHSDLVVQGNIHFCVAEDDFPSLTEEQQQG
jgi:hypothetical protein